MREKRKEKKRKEKSDQDGVKRKKRRRVALWDVNDAYIYMKALVVFTKHQDFPPPHQHGED